MAAAAGPSSISAMDLDWMAGLRPGHQVALMVYGHRMTGKVIRINPDNFTVVIPVTDQSADMRRFSVTGTAIVSLESAAATVPVTVRATGEYVRMQVIGAADIVQRRRFVRIRVAVPVTLSWRHDHGELLSVDSCTEDLSAGGARIASARTVWPSAGEEVNLVFEESPSKPGQDRATVIGKTPDYGLRLEFSRLCNNTRQWLTDLIEESGES